MNKLRVYWQENKPIWYYILLLFVVTRVALSIIGWVSVTYLPQQTRHDWKTKTIYVGHPYLSMWAVWDSNSYLEIAQNGYADVTPFIPTGCSNIGFFPLYPATISIVQLIVGDFLLAGWLVANFFLLLAAYFLYKLIKLDHDTATAERGLWYLFLFPSAYILSAVYPESMLLCAWLATILYARKGDWWTAGLIGFLAAFIKPSGFFIAIPLLLLYLFRDREFSLAWPISLKSFKIKIRLDIISTALPLLGLFIWGLGNYFLTGDILAYAHVQQGAWYHHWAWPFITLYQNLFSAPDYFFNSLTVILALIILLFGYKRIPFSYWIFAVVVVLFNPATGAVIGSWRYLASTFPILFILISWGKSETINRAILVSMALLQGCLFVFWVASAWFVS